MSTDPNADHSASLTAADLHIIDCHTHIDRLWIEDDPLTPTELLEWMDENAIDRAVIQSLESPEGSGRYLPSERVLEVTSEYPDRFIAFCSFDPRINTETRDTEGEFRSLIEYFIDHGARGFGECKCGVPFDHTRMQLIYELCGEYGLPVLLHTDNQSLWDGVGMHALEEMARTYSETDFIVHSHGWWSHISKSVSHGDLDRLVNPTGPIESGGRCGELLSEYDNIYGDISAGSGWNALTRDPAFARDFLETHYEQIVFGTDRLPGFEPTHVELIERYDIGPERWRAICSENFESLLL